MSVQLSATVMLVSNGERRVLTNGVLPTAPVNPSTAREVNVRLKGLNLRALNMTSFHLGPVFGLVKMSTPRTLARADM